MARLTAERLRELLNYCPETGVFTWRIKPCSRISVGAVAGSASHGYLEISIESERFLAHRLAWLYTHGVWPAFQIDHLNGQRSDNRIANLRDVEPRINCQNQRKAKGDNKLSGRLGVYFDRGSQKWRPKIQVDGKQIYGGSYASVDEAASAYIELKRQHHVGCTI